MRGIIILIVLVLAGGFLYMSSSPSKEDLNKGDKELAQFEETQEKEEGYEMDKEGEVITEGNDDSGTAGAAAEYALDIAQSNFNFTGGLASHDQNGRFASWNSKLMLAEGASLEDLQVEVLIDMDSMETGSQGLTDHLKAEDFFETAKYPTATFKSTSIVQEQGEYLCSDWRFRHAWS